jgi:hypothetical protein
LALLFIDRLIERLYAAPKDGIGSNLHVILDD